MSDKTGISWTDASWNVLRGCSIVSPGCTNCYAMNTAYRFSGPGRPYEGLAHKVNGHAVWTGEVRFVEHLLDQPKRWTKPRRVFVNSMADLFHEAVPDEWLDRIFDVMEACPQHVFQILTKRPERMRDYIRARMWGERGRVYGWRKGSVIHGCPSHIWLGVSVEDQRRADERIPVLLDTPATVRFLSCEPLLGPVDLSRFMFARYAGDEGFAEPESLGALSWVIVGGESGPRHRPMNLDWARGILCDCICGDVPFFFKQTSGPKSGMGEDALGKGFHEFPEVVV